jgi:hypothetical protein
MRISRWIESDGHVHSIVEQRKSNRYALRAPVLFEWAPQNEEPQSGRGVTRDINTFGVFIVTDTLPPVGALVQMDILLPKLEAPGFGMSLAGEGMVLRVESSGSERGSTNEPGFAASVQFYPETAESTLSHLETFGRVV